MPAEPTALPNAGRAIVTQKASDAGLDANSYRHVHDFAFGNWDMDTKISLIYIAIAGLETKLDKLTKLYDRVRKTTDKILDFVDHGWTMKTPLKAAVRDLMYHTVITPTSHPGPDHMVDRIITYIFTHPHSYEIDKVKDSQIVRAIVTAYVRSELPNCRSAVRKDIFNMVKGGVPLQRFARTLADDYSLPPKPIVFDDDQLSYFALMRKIAIPLASKPNNKGQDTGYWKALEKECRALFEAHGETHDRTTAQWRSWKAKAIAEDEEQFRMEDRSRTPSRHSHSSIDMSPSRTPASARPRASPTMSTDVPPRSTVFLSPHHPPTRSPDSLASHAWQDPRLMDPYYRDTRPPFTGSTMDTRRTYSDPHDFSFDPGEY